MKPAKITVLVAAIGLFLVWMVTHLRRIIGVGDSDGVIRLVLGTLFSLLILFRWKARKRDSSGEFPSSLPVGLGVVGCAFVLIGLIMDVNQFEWLGIVSVLAACLLWSLPRKFAKDIFLGLFLLYWIHPLPGQIFDPLQFVMQSLSVKGAEWLLHCVNVRAWADGFVLYSGVRTFDVPAACSGMKTAVTVLICTFGVCALFRFRWYEMLLFVVLGLVQVLVLNILRIGLMVIWSFRMSPVWSETVLHDTLGVFLLVTVLLVQLEASWWKVYWDRRKKKARDIEQGNREHDDEATTLPRVWHLIFQRGWVAVMILVLLIGVACVTYKKRPRHRAAMISGVVDDLQKMNMEVAERAVLAAIEFAPHDQELRSKHFRILVQRRKFQQALEVVDQYTETPGIADTVMKSWALMALGRLDESEEVLASLPENAKRFPDVAIIRAEHSARRDRPDEVAQSIVLAANSTRTMERVRSLYPYLAAREQWQAIADSDNRDAPFTQFLDVTIVIDANLKVGNTGGAADALRRGLATWPDDVRFVRSLLSIAVSRPDEEWERHIESILHHNISDMDVASLATCVSSCFELKRPGLAWMAYLRLKQVNGTHPALYLAPAQYGREWFVCRRKALDVGANNDLSEIDLGLFLSLVKHMAPFKSLWALIPLADELSGENVVGLQGKYLRMYFSELAHRRSENSLSPEMEMMYPGALAMAGRYEEAHDALDEIGRKYPSQKQMVVLRHAAFYNQQGLWRQSYENLRSYRQEVGRPSLNTEIMTITAMMNLNMAIGAMEIARLARINFPNSPQVEGVIAGIWAAFGFKEQALFILDEGTVDTEPRAVAQLLFDTGRTREANKMCRGLGISIDRARSHAKPWLVRPAEFAITRRWPDPLSKAERNREAKRLTAQAGESSSPFVAGLATLEAEWLRSGSKTSVDLQRWEDVGRDRIEKAVSLNRLTMLLAQQRTYELAAEAASRAVDLIPSSAILWRVLIALTEGDVGVLSRASAACPDDPDIWLASLVVGVEKMQKDADAAEWAESVVEAAIEHRKFSVKTMIRAGDFLLRKDMAEVATLASDDAVARCRGLATAYVLGLRTAIRRQDLKQALFCSLRGADHAVDPSPFYRVIVELKSLGREMDADAISALEYLKGNFPRDPQWPERLGYMYFEGGDTARAMMVMESMLQGDIKNVRAESFMLAAEVARLEGKPARSREILEYAYRLYPRKVGILNNLVYSLAADRTTVKRAVTLLPELLKKGKNSAAVLDTAAVVYLNIGQIPLAWQYMEKAMMRIGKNEYAALEIGLNAARILHAMGRHAEAREKLEEIRKNRKCPENVDLAARALLAEIPE